MKLWHTIRPLVLLPVAVLADLPVHCLRHQIVGDWEFTLSPSKSERSSCGHQKPDSQDKQPALSLLGSMGPTTKLRLSVEDPDTVSTSKGKAGSWTMIYDEGFEVVVNGQVFFAFSKFEMVPDGRGGQTNVSHCGETFIGWYRDSSRTRWGCYFGKKVGHGEAPPQQPAALRSTRGVPAKAPQATALVSKATSTIDLGDLIGDDDEQATDQGSQDQRATDESSQDQRANDQASQDERAADQGSVDARAVDQAPQDLQAQNQVSRDQQPPERGPREPASGQAPRGQGEDQASQDQGSVIEAAFAAVDEEPRQSAPVSKAAPVTEIEPLQAAFAQAKLEQEAEESGEDDAGDQDGNEEQAEVEQSSTSAPAARNVQSFLADAYTMPSSYTPWVPKSAGYDKPMPHHFQQAVAEALNFMQLGWTAAPYRMFTGKTPRELNRFAGVRRSRVPPQRKGKTSAKLAHAVDSPEPLSFLGLGSRRKRSRHGDQQSLDWRKVSGRNWLVPVVSQGDCGSCYAISTVHMLTARNRIKRGDPAEPAFSVTFPLRCSEYNQGCNGGYGFLESKWAEDVGLVPESCSPFSDDTDGACQGLEDCDLGDKRYRAVNHRYVGGFYGGSDHEAIRRELVSNGPLVLSFEPKEDFMYYKSGLYKSGRNKIHQEWEQVDHAVLLVGLGLDAEQPYWVLQNSWGTEWGEQGFFRMARGIDESGCESIAVAADVMQDSSNDVLDNFLASL